MNVIFLETVSNVGKAGEVKNVTDGYARNYLIPRKLALPATKQAIKQFEEQKDSRARMQAKTEDEMQSLAAQLEGKEITIQARVGSNERLHGSITSSDIASALKTEGFVIDKRKIELSEAIHQTGSYEITLKLLKDINPKVKLNVVEGK